jgi:hypothetical protein
VELISQNCNWLETTSWIDGGGYSSGSPSIALLNAIQSHKLETIP